MQSASVHWAAGFGVIRHREETQRRINDVVARLRQEGVAGDGLDPFDVLIAADRLGSAAMWLAVHQVYAQAVHLDGRELTTVEFKIDPQGHLGGVLNMVPAYVGYLAANALTGHTRAWLMGQGHGVGAVDSTNVLVGNTTPVHAARYDVSDEGLGRFCRDFYSYALDDTGRQDSPVGSHVNAYTAGGLAEGGYLGFAELEYPHMPLLGERLVAFLSDGAFEEQRGSDWAPRWWRPFDSGLVAPIMIKNGRRIDQRTTMAQSGGTAWFVDHLRLNNFDPIVIDGTDPAAFAWAILEIERREEAAARSWADDPKPPYGLPLPYAVAVAPKGYGFYGAGTNPAHNLPLPGNPRFDPSSATTFHDSIRDLWVPPHELSPALARFAGHDRSSRPRERDHPLAVRNVRLEQVPATSARPVPEDRASGWRRADWPRSSPMDRIDAGFVATLRANPHLRPRVGNPDEMRSNRLLQTLDELHFRVTDPEAGLPESVDGAVITALNEEAVVAAGIANKGGINLVHTYEAFGTKMFGNLRQEIIFTAALAEAGRPTGWLSMPLCLTSHTWENGKNEQSHQDPSLAELLWGEVSHVARVLFPADANTAGELIAGVFQTNAQIWAIVAPKRDVPELFDPDEARRLLINGAIEVPFAGDRRDSADVVLTAVGAYQLHEVLRASARLAERGEPHRVVYMIEPARFRRARCAAEQAHLVPPETAGALYPASAPFRVFLSHTRPEPLLGLLGPLHTGRTTRALGYISRGGTLDVRGMLFVNEATWAHVLRAVAEVRGVDESEYLTEAEREALAGRRTPTDVI
ncbi:MAG: xylulose 5-phosphate 3-epimerase [Chloroflexota bacterium]